MRNTPGPTPTQQVVTLRTGRALPELLQELVDEGKSQVAIAAELNAKTDLNISRNTVAMWLREFSIEPSATPVIPS